MPETSATPAEPPARILVVEDEPAIAAFIRRGLVFEGYTVETVGNGHDALARLRDQPPDLLLLDLMLPEVDGLEIGADDYLVKPFAFDELLARVKALLRRGRAVATSAPVVAPALVVDDLVLDPGARTVHRGGRAVTLTTREFDLLHLLMRHPHQVLPRSTIMSRVWGDDFFGDSNVLEVTIGAVRRELEAAGEPRLIQTVRGVGYVIRQG